jgi:predicted nucleotidyltransferase
MKMKGKNLIDIFTRAGNDVVSQLMGHDSVVGVLFTGGIARGFADKYSDVDVHVFISEEDASVHEQVKAITSEIEDRQGFETDIEVHVFDSFMEQEWNEYLRWDLSNSKIAFDRQGMLSSLLAERLKMNEEEWKLRVARAMIYLSWYSFPERSDIPSMIDLWDDRGDPASAQYAVSYALELIVEILYALNRSYLPAPKWRLHYIKNLEWVPEGFWIGLEEGMLIREISVEDARRRASSLLSIWKDLLVQIQKVTGLNYESAKKLYVQKVLHQLTEQPLKK